MHWFTEQDSKLIVKELPLGKWIMGLLIFLLFPVIVLISLFDKNLPTLLAGIFTFPFVVGSIYIFSTSPFITITVDRFRETVSIEKQTLFNYKISTINFRELDGLLSIREKTAGSLTTYYIKIPLKNNPKMEKSIELETLNRDFYKAVKRMNDYIEKPRNKSLPKN